MQFDYSLTSPQSTLGGDSAVMNVFGYDSLHNISGANVAHADVSPGGFCVSDFTIGSTVCTNPAASAYSLPFQAMVNTVYPIQLSAGAGVVQGNGAPQVTTASAVLDPVISFAPGFDSTGFDVAVSPGIGNSAESAPEPTTFTLLGFAAAGGIVFRSTGATITRLPARMAGLTGG